MTEMANASKDPARSSTDSAAEMLPIYPVEKLPGPAGHGGASGAYFLFPVEKLPGC